MRIAATSGEPVTWARSKSGPGTEPGSADESGRPAAAASARLSDMPHRLSGVSPTSPAGSAGKPPRLLLVDGHSLAYRAFFALPVENFSTTTGQVTNAVYGFTSMLINVLRDEAPDHVAVAFDVSRQTFRSETYAAYKAN